MLTDSVKNEDTGSTSLPVDASDNCYTTTQFIQIVPVIAKYMAMVPVTRGADGSCSTERDSGDWSAEVKQENLPVVKQEPDDVS